MKKKPTPKRASNANTAPSPIKARRGQHGAKKSPAAARAGLKSRGERALKEATKTGVVSDELRRALKTATVAHRAGKGRGQLRLLESSKGREGQPFAPGPLAGLSSERPTSADHSKPKGAQIPGGLQKSGQKFSPSKNPKLSPAEIKKLKGEYLFSCMQYLHGDVADGNYEAACIYEYARASEILRKAARLLRGGLKVEEVFCEMKHHNAHVQNFLELWECPSFPEKSWNQLTATERERIALAYPFPADKVLPLRMNEVWNLESNGIFDELKRLAATQMQSKRTSGTQRAPKVYPVIEGWPKRKEQSSPWVHALFTLDFRKTPKQLRNEFEIWLKQPENKSRFDTHKINTTGTTGVFRDRLKDLAAWRILDQLRSIEAANIYVRDNRLTDEAGIPRPFFDARAGQASDKFPLNDAPLYREESGWRKACKEAKAFTERLLAAPDWPTATETAPEEEKKISKSSP
ncbi:MAG: hypothetical protein WCO94_11175 [Verrucomicrobiota bacterium]